MSITNIFACILGGISAAILIHLYLGMRSESGSLDRRMERMTEELNTRMRLPQDLHKKHGAEWDRVRALEDDAEFLRARDDMVRREPMLANCLWFNYEEQVRERTLLRLSQLTKK